jgi:hypothetical protein
MLKLLTDHGCRNAASILGVPLSVINALTMAAIAVYLGLQALKVRSQIIS